MQYDLKNPTFTSGISTYSAVWFDTVVTLGVAGSRGVHLLRSGDVNIPTPRTLADGTLFFPPGQARPNTAFGVIELKSSDGDSWYNAFILEVRKRLSRGFYFQSSYTLSRNIDTTQASTFFSDATNGTTSAFPEFPGVQYNKGLADYHAKHNFVFNFIWDIPFARNLKGAAGKILDGWQLAGIGQLRSGNPLTVFVQRNRSRSQWSPSIGPGLGLDRPSFVPGRTAESAVTGDPNGYFDPTIHAQPPDACQRRARRADRPACAPRLSRSRTLAGRFWARTPTYSYALKASTFSTARISGRPGCSHSQAKEITSSRFQHSA